MDFIAAQSNKVSFYFVEKKIINILYLHLPVKKQFSTLKLNNKHANSRKSYSWNRQSLDVCF